VTTPEEALARARKAVAGRRGRGEDLDVGAGFRVEPADNVDPNQLLEWAVIEPDPALVYSTRRLGAPVTLAKRLLIFALRQYTVQIVDQQTRFNLQLASFVAELDRRVGRLEAAREGGGAAPDRGGSVLEGGGLAPEGGGSAPDRGGSAPIRGGSAPDGGGGSAPDGGGSAPDGGGSAPDRGGSALPR